MKNISSSKRSYNSRNSFANIILLIIFLFMSLLFAEGFIRLFYPQRVYDNYKSIDAPIFTESDIIPWTLKPQANGTQVSPYKEFSIQQKINSLGVRGPELTKKNVKTKRILFLGDSFTFGYGVSEKDSYPRQVETILNQNKKERGFKFDVVNAGYADGYSPDTYYVYLKNFLNLFDPDLVIVGFYTRNDIVDLSTTTWNSTDNNGLPIKVSSPHYYIDSNGRRKKPKVGIFKNELIYETHLFLFSTSHLYVLITEYLNNTFFNQYEDPIFSAEWGTANNKNWIKVKKILVAMNSLLKGHNISMALVIINSRIQTVDSYWKLYKKKYQSKSLKRFRPNEELVDLCKTEDIPCLDLQNIFSKQIDPESYYFPIDAHWNPKGHHLSANAIASFIERYIFPPTT